MTKANGLKLHLSRIRRIEQKLVAEKAGGTLTSPYDQENIILGQVTVIYEFQIQMKEDYNMKLDAVIIPVGGGLLDGCAVARVNSGT